MNLADNLKKLRKDNNMSQEDLADKLGVSRQSVSKWESGQAYPEMDKVLQLCKLFNLNINDLLNEDINEVKEKKDTNNKYNKYYEDFLDFITRTVKLFSALRFRDKIKLIIEEVLLIFGLWLVYIIVGNILSNVFSYLYNIRILGPSLESIYTIVYLILAIIVLVHIFKIRYLDYYKVVDKEKLEEEIVLEKDTVVEEKKKPDKVIPKKEDKIIIRDEKHSSYSFLNGLANIFIFFIKFILFFIMLGIASVFIANVVSLVLIFMIRHNGLLFSGLLIGGLGSLLFLGLVTLILFLIIVNKKVRYKVCGILFIVSFILIGIGLGLGAMSIKDIKIMGLDGDRVAKETKTIKMSKDLFIEDNMYFDVKYIEEDRKDILIVTKRVGDKPIDIIEDRITEGNRVVYFSAPYYDDMDIESIKQAIDDLDHKKIYDYDHVIEVYASKDNIDTLIKNEEKLKETKEEE